MTDTQKKQKKYNGGILGFPFNWRLDDSKMELKYQFTILIMSTAHVIEYLHAIWLIPSENHASVEIDSCILCNPRVAHERTRLRLFIKRRLVFQPVAAALHVS